MSLKLNIGGFGSRGHAREFPNHEHDGCSASPRMKSKSYWPEMKQDNSMGFCGYSFNNIDNKIAQK